MESPTKEEIQKVLDENPILKLLKDEKLSTNDLKELYEETRRQLIKRGELKD